MTIMTSNLENVEDNHGCSGHIVQEEAVKENPGGEEEEREAEQEGRLDGEDGEQGAEEGKPECLEKLIAGTEDLFKYHLHFYTSSPPRFDAL